MSEDFVNFENLNESTESEQEKKPKGWWNHDKEFDLGADNNPIYWEQFKNFKWGDSIIYKEGMTETEKKKVKNTIFSMRQYKSSIMNFMQFVKKDILTVSRKEIDEFLATVKNETTRQNKQAHIKSILVFIVQHNIMGAMGRVTKNALLVIIIL
jgi:hypothetical protein